jgi:putative transposase
MSNPFKYFNSSPEVIRGRDDVRQVPAVAAQRRGSPGRAGIDISHETIRFWWNRFGPMFAAETERGG